MMGTPAEYISLGTPYVMDAPKLANPNCDGETVITDTKFVGITTFEQVGIWINTMVLRKDQHTFANRTSDTKYNFGYVTDCYTAYPNQCGPRGNAVVDTRGTGLKLKDTVNWSYKNGTTSYSPQVTRFDGGQRIEVMCGGRCGSCWIQGAAELTFVDSDTPAEDTATMPSC